MTRTAGVLLHPTSLPGRYGISDLCDELIALLDWAQSAGIRIWQVLPLNPPGYGNSPYGCHSSYAGNPLLISPLHLQQDGLLPEHAIDALPDKQRAAVMMHKYQELEYSQIAKSLGCSESAVKSLLFRAYETLRERLAHMA